VQILIAEDDAVSRRLLVASLAKRNHEPIVARDGAEAWKVLESPNAPPMAILDWMMPAIEGTELVRRLRVAEGDPLRPCYVILLTSRESHDDIVAGFAAGADDYVTKPFDMRELEARIRVGVRMIELRQKLRDRVSQLEEALDKVHTLQGLLPICAYCKRIRDDRNYWNEVESYLVKLSGAELSHGVCPECFETHVRAELARIRS
jgi:DNA-binding response OmpR family regulator